MFAPSFVQREQVQVVLVAQAVQAVLVVPVALPEQVVLVVSAARVLLEPVPAVRRAAPMAVRVLPLWLRALRPR